MYLNTHARTPTHEQQGGKDVFFKEGDPSEARLLLSPVKVLVARLLSLLAEFPEHSILEQVP